MQPPPDPPTVLVPGTPAAEVDITESLVTRLLREQHPDLLDLPLRHVASGWDNATWRLGDDLALRLPRRTASAQLILHEQRWLPEIARRVSLPVPEPLRVGRPSGAYPWSWSVVRWLEGEDATRVPVAATEAARLGRFLGELHEPAPSEAPQNPFRGVPLTERQSGFDERFARLRSTLPAGTLDFEALLEIWRDALAEPFDEEARWLHGDLHPKNVLAANGRLVGIVDWGDLAGGDPATDLASAWMLFPRETRAELWRSYGDPDAGLLRRAAGWATLLGVILLDTGLADDPPFREVGRRTLVRLVEWHR